MNQTRLLITSAVAALLIAAGPIQAGAAEEFEIPGPRSASQILGADKLKGPHYQIQEKVVSYGFMNHWTVDSDFGTFETTGDGALRKLLNEIRAIAALKEVSTAEAVGDSIVTAAKHPFQLFGDLVTHPVDTVSGIPEGVGTIFGNAGEAVTMEHDPSEDSRAEQLLFVSSWKRDYCHEFDCDVYSSNKALQKELNRVGWAAALGGFSLSAASMAASGAATAVLSNMRLADQVKDAVKEEPPARLRIKNEKGLQAMGVPDALAQKFLDHPNFTPRHDTVIVSSLGELQGAQGREVFIEATLAANDEASANFFQNMAQTFLGYNDTAAPIKSFTSIGGFPVAQDANGSAVIAIPADRAIYGEKGHRFLTAMKKAYKVPGFNGRFIIWLTGTISPKGKENFTKMGAEITENVDEKIGFMD